MPARFGPGGNCEDFHAAGNNSSVQVFKWLSEHGLELYEYQAGRGIKCSPEMTAEMAEQAKKYNIAVSVHAPYYISIASEAEEKRRNSIDYILESLRFAQKIGATKIVCHAGSAGKQTRLQAMDVAKETLNNTVAVVYKNKLDKIKIGIETMGKENQLGTLEEIIEFCKLDSLFIPVVDFGHIYSRSLGCDLLKVEDYLRIFETIENELGRDILNNLHCHFSKIEYTQKGEKNHLKLSDKGFGPDYIQFIEAVVQAKIAPDVICETAGTMTKDAQTMKKRYLKQSGV